MTIAITMAISGIQKGSSNRGNGRQVRPRPCQNRRHLNVADNDPIAPAMRSRGRMSRTIENESGEETTADPLEHASKNHHLQVRRQRRNRRSCRKDEHGDDQHPLFAVVLPELADDRGRDGRAQEQCGYDPAGGIDGGVEFAFELGQGRSNSAKHHGVVRARQPQHEDQQSRIHLRRA
ncbi:MAG: hypothetical protein R2845_12540 [Thermomicrobiales bacterium]